MKSALQSVIEKYQTKDFIKCDKPERTDDTILEHIKKLEYWYLYDKFVIDNVNLRYTNLCIEIY